MARACFLFPLSVMLTACLLCLSVADAAPPEKATPDTLFSAVRLTSAMTFCDERVNLDFADARERMEKEMLLTLWDRPQVVLWIKRAARYMPIIEAKLKKNRLPEDLKYISLVESALRPHAGSPKGAMGFWQFTAGTGQKYGLQVDSEKDERRNIFKSTDAAMKYLKDLYSMFGSWTLAAAAFNMGEQGLLAEIMVQDERDFYKLYLPLETQRYVFRIISAKIILSRPENYGFFYEKQDLYAPLTYDRISLDCFQETPIAVVARAAGTHFKMIKDLNPEIRGHYLYPGQHRILVPNKSGNGFYARFSKQLAKYNEKQQNRIYVVKAGDNLSVIADRFNIPLPVLIIWNKLDISQNIHPGDRLIIFPPEGNPAD